MARPPVEKANTTVPRPDWKCKPKMTPIAGIFPVVATKWLAVRLSLLLSLPQVRAWPRKRGPCHPRAPVSTWCGTGSQPVRAQVTNLCHTSSISNRQTAIVYDGQVPGPANGYGSPPKASRILVTSDVMLILPSGTFGSMSARGFNGAPSTFLNLSTHAVTS